MPLPRRHLIAFSNNRTSHARHNSAWHNLVRFHARRVSISNKVPLQRRRVVIACMRETVVTFSRYINQSLLFAGASTYRCRVSGSDITRTHHNSSSQWPAACLLHTKVSDQLFWNFNKDETKKVPDSRYQVPHFGNRNAKKVEAC